MPTKELWSKQCSSPYRPNALWQRAHRSARHVLSLRGTSRGVENRAWTFAEEVHIGTECHNDNSFTDKAMRCAWLLRAPQHKRSLKKPFRNQKVEKRTWTFAEEVHIAATCFNDKAFAEEAPLSA